MSATHGGIDFMSVSKAKIIIFGLIFLSIGIIAGLYFGNQKERKTIDDVAKGLLDNSTTYSPNNVLEATYKENKSNLPIHHTVCIPVKKVFCQDGICKQDNPAVFDLLGGSGLEQKTFSRCDKNSCDTYDALVEDSGDYKNIQTDTPRGMLLKMSFLDKKYVEVVTAGLGTFLSSGYCRYVQFY